ncbi:MAG: efflux RND transporter permease subunit [Chloroflexi bacterium]|nr:efflux RND transporter permease subunit [Chloroflexota bacterium]
MKLTRLAVYRPVVALTVTLALVLFGIASYFSLGLENNPELKLPIVTITAVYPGASAETVEEQVTRKIEDAVAGLPRIKTMTSTSQTSVSQIVVEFEEGVDVDIAASDVQQKVSGVRRDMPAEVDEPSYAKLDFNDVPIVNLAVTSVGDADPASLYRVANDVIRPRLENVSGVGRVEVVGGTVPEVLVEVQPDRLRAYGLTLDDVTNAVRSQYVTASGGQIKSGSGDTTRGASLRLDARGDVSRLGTIPVGGPGTVGVELRHVANVYLGGKEVEQIVRVNGKAAAGLLVYKQSKANITRTVDAVTPQVEKLNGELPPGYQLQLVIDQSRYVRDTVDEVQHELLLASLITGIVLFFFLHSLRSTIIVLIAIPMSLLVALIVMKLVGLSLNGLTLIGLTTAIGVLVDDSIVVLENIFSHLETGKDPKTAAVDGRSEIGMAAIAITLVDVAVWGPIIFITGITGAFLRNFAIVMVAATLASLLVSFTLTPLIASRWLSQANRTGRASLFGRFAQLFEPIYGLTERVYRVLLHWSLRHRPVVLAGALLVFSSNVLILQHIGSEFIPEGDMDVVTLAGELPAGTALDATDLAARRWERQLLDKERFPEVHLAYVRVGGRDARAITVDLEVGKPATRTRTSKEIARAAIAAGQATTPDLRARRQTDGGPSGQPVQVHVFGDNLEQLNQMAGQAEQALAALPELADVTNSLTAAPEVTIRPDPSRLRDLGANAQHMGTVLRVAYQGAVVGKWPEPGGKERDVRVIVPATLRNRPEAVANLPLFEREGRLVTVSQVATTEVETKPTKIGRVDRQRVATLGAEPSDVPLGTASEEVTRTMNALTFPQGMRWEMAGTSEEQQNSFAMLLFGLGASIVLMYLVLTVLYESWLQPVLILTALPLATVGAFLGLLVFNQTLSIPSFIGLIALFGLVGKNSILLVDRANDLRRHGMDRTTALEHAGPSRLRPILMTSAVLILSMLPVSLQLGGDGSGRAPLGAVLVGGMTTSTFLSLLYVPVAYTYFDSFGQFMGRLFGWRPPRRRGTPVTVRPTPLPMAGGASLADERLAALRGRLRKKRRPTLATTVR